MAPEMHLLRPPALLQVCAEGQNELHFGAAACQGQPRCVRAAGRNREGCKGGCGFNLWAAPTRSGNLHNGMAHSPGIIALAWHAEIAGHTMDHIEMRSNLSITEMTSE